ncbi:MAG: ABC transporter ATP-binding protein, partial [Clostridia bacterium]
MIDVHDLTFSYQKEPVLKKLTFHVNQGEIFGFLGPSGAGKSTLQKLLIGLLPNYGGTATVMGFHCDHLKRSFFSRVGVDFEVSTLYERLTARENLRFFGSLYARPCFDINELLGRLGLTQAANMRVNAYSKGMKSRLNFARAILHNPDLLFLDEPTSGLDPTSAAAMKDVIKGLRGQGKTIVLSTHNMQDALELCDRVAFLADGQIKALDNPHRLIMARGARKLTYTYQDAANERTCTVPLNQTSRDAQLLQLLKSDCLRSVHSDEPTLSDIFT